jgi:hypothetical protein
VPGCPADVQIATERREGNLVPTVPALVMIDHIDHADQMLIWVALALCLWLALFWLIRRLNVPEPILVAATLSWLVAWLFIRVVPILLHEIGSWPRR